MIVEALGNGVFRVELSNGHRLVGRAGASAQARAGRLVPGDRVTLRVSPADFSRGRIMLPERPAETMIGL